MSTPGDPHDPSLARDFGTNGPDPDFELAPLFADDLALREAEERAEQARKEHANR